MNRYPTRASRPAQPQLQPHGQTPLLDRTTPLDRTPSRCLTPRPDAERLTDPARRRLRSHKPWPATLLALALITAAHLAAPAFVAPAFADPAAATSAATNLDDAAPYAAPSDPRDDDRLTFHPVTLDEVLALLEEQGYLRDLTMARRRLAEAERVHAELRPDPTFEYEVQGTLAGLDFVDGSQHLMALTLPVRLTRKRAARRIAAEAGIRAADATNDQLRAMMRAEVRIAWVDAQMELARVRELERLLDELERLITVVRAREQAGVSSRYDTSRLEFEREQLTDGLASVYRELLAASAELANAIGIPGWLPIPAETELPAPAPPHAVASDRISSGAVPVLAAAQAEVDAAEARVESARRERVPDLDVGMGVIVSTIQPGLAGYGALSVPLPFRDGGRADVARAEAEAIAARTERDVLTRTLTVRADTLRARLERARADLERYDRHVIGRLDGLRRMVESAYLDGDSGIAELIDLVESEAEARLDRIDRLEEALMLEAEYLLMLGL